MQKMCQRFQRQAALCSRETLLHTLLIPKHTCPPPCLPPHRHFSQNNGSNNVADSFEDAFTPNPWQIQLPPLKNHQASSHPIRPIHQPTQSSAANQQLPFHPRLALISQRIPPCAPLSQPPSISEPRRFDGWISSNF